MNKTFEISRIHTPLGIFRVSGEVSDQNTMAISQLEIMGTDGWLFLDIQSAKVANLIKQLEPHLLAHLQGLVHMTDKLSNKNLALFDFDGTLTDADMFTIFLKFSATKKRAWLIKLTLLPLYGFYKLGLFPAPT